jgi:hypothetical protein
LLKQESLPKHSKSSVLSVNPDSNAEKLYYYISYFFTCNDK